MSNLHRIQIRSLTRHTPAHALEVDLAIEPGEMLALVGASGAGKSRLFRILAGLDRPISGQVEWLDEARAEVISTEMSELHPRQNVREHLEHSLKKMNRRDRPSASEQAYRVHRVLELLELESLSERRASTLSSGELRRLAVGCGLVRRPPILLFDELHCELGCTSIFATQDVEDAMCLGSRMAVLHEGSIVQSGSPQELYRDPAHRSVAALFGTCFLEGRLDVRDGELLFAFADGENEGQFPLSFVQGMPEVPGAEHGRGSIVLGVRPESIRVARAVEELGGGYEILEPAKPTQVVLTGWEMGEGRASREEALHFGLLGGALRRVARVRGTEWLGRETRLLLEVGGQPWQASGPARGEGSKVLAGLRAGERLWVELDREGLLWFDAQGARLRSPEVPTAEPLSTLALEDEPGTRGLKISPEKKDESGASELSGQSGRSK
jgi:ABC-type sugar transport system ATPase subunit